MALSFVEGKTVNNTTGVATTAAFTNTFAVGQLVVVAVNYDGGSNVTTSVTDNATTPNTYTLIPGASKAGTGIFQAVYYAKITTAKASPTVTVNYTSTSSNAVVTAQYFNGFVSTPTLDESTSSANATSTTVTSGASGVTAQAIELIVGVGSIGHVTAAFTLGAGYTNLSGQSGSVSLVKSGIGMESLITASTGAQTATFTLNATAVNVGGVVTFYDAASGSLPSVSDTATTSEAITLGVASFVSDSDTVTTSETVNLIKVDNIAVSDTVTTSEVIGLLSQENVAISDTLTTTESTTLLIPTLFISVNDTTTTSETVKVESNNFIKASDTTTTSENIFVIPSGIYFDAASNSGYKAALSTYNWSHTTTGTNLGLLVNVSIFATGTVTGVTYNSVALQFIRFDSIGVYRNEIWVLEGPTLGTNNVVVTLNTSLTSIASAASYTGVNQTEMVESNTGTTGSGVSSPSLSLATTTDQAWIIDGLTTSDTSMSVTGSQTQRDNNSGALGTGALGDLGPVTPTAMKTMSWSAVTITDSWALSVIAIDPAGEIISPLIAASDTANTSESIGILSMENISVSDSTTASELVNLLITSQVTTSDSTATSENVILLVSSAVSVSDTTATSEALTILSTPNDSIADSTATTESVVVQVQSGVSVTDTSITSENVQLLESVSIIVSDSIVTSEALNINRVSNDIIADTTSVSELVQVAIQTSVTVNDSATTTENVIAQLGSTDSVTDIVTTGESINVVIVASGVLPVVVSDTTTTSENVSVFIPGVTGSIKREIYLLDGSFATRLGTVDSRVVMLINGTLVIKLRQDLYMRL